MEDFNSKYTGEQVEALLDIVSQGGSSGGGGGTITEADIANMGFTKNQGTITEVKMNGVSKGTSGVVDLGNVITEHQDISGKVDKVTGKGLSTEDFTTALKNKLEGLSNYDDTTLSNALTTLRNDFDKLVSGDSTTAIKTFNEIIAFLDGIADTEDLASIIASIEQQIAGKMDKVALAAVATSGDYNDLNNKPTMQKALIIGDSSDEAKANYAALVNGTVSADYYIGSIAFDGNILQGVVSPYIASAHSGGVGYFVIAEFPLGGGNSGQIIKATCSCTKEGVVSTTIEKPLDGKQNTISDLATIREGAAKGATSVQPNDIENVAHKDDGYVVANGILDEGDHYWHLPNSSADEEQYTLASKADIKGVVYVADFTMDSLVMGMQEQEQISCDIPSLVAAMEANKVILVRQNESSDYKGAFVLNGFVEDLLYFSIVDTNSTVLCCETSYDNATYIDGRDLYVKTWQDPITDLEAIRSGASKGATAVQMLQYGEMECIQTQGFEGSLSGKLYALPSEDTGDEDDILLSKKSVKTINGESIFGSGNITIEGGGSGGEVYITPFTVEQFCTGNVTLTDEQRNELLNAASQNKIIGIPYYIQRNVIETGYIIANYYYSLDDLSTPYIWSLRLGIVFEGAHYNNFISSHSNPNNFFATRAVITPFKPLMHTVTAEDGVAIIEDDAVFTDNRIFFVGGECTELYIYVEPSKIGKTVRFFTGESCTLEFVYPVYWANGEIPTIEPYTHYELSLVQNMEYAYNAVLTPFKPVE